MHQVILILYMLLPKDLFLKNDSQNFEEYISKNKIIN